MSDPPPLPLYNFTPNIYTPTKHILVHQPEVTRLLDLISGTGVRWMCRWKRGKLDDGGLCVIIGHLSLHQAESTASAHELEITLVCSLRDAGYRLLHKYDLKLWCRLEGFIFCRGTIFWTYCHRLTHFWIFIIYTLFSVFIKYNLGLKISLNIWKWTDFEFDL